MNALKYLEQAEICIDNHYVDLAREMVCSLPEPQYDQIMAWSVRVTDGYRYFLSRFVLESIEPVSLYNPKDGRSQDLAIYKAQLTLIRTLPADVMSTPYKVVKAKKHKDKSATLAMSFS